MYDATMHIYDANNHTVGKQAEWVVGKFGDACDRVFMVLCNEPCTKWDLYEPDQDNENEPLKKFKNYFPFHSVLEVL